MILEIIYFTLKKLYFVADQKALYLSGKRG